MNGIFMSPPEDRPLSGGEASGSPYEDEENLIRVKLYFYCEEKALRSRVFPEEWYTVVADEFGPDQTTPEF